MTEYPGVKGMQQPLFFWRHDHLEGGDGDNKSKFNKEEARMAAKLAKYLVQQGYRHAAPTLKAAFLHITFLNVAANAYKGY